MYFISLGTHCTVADGIKLAGKRIESYPFDWLWCPSKTTLSILEILINKSSYDACQYMTTGYGYYMYEKPEYFKRVNYITKDQMNPTTGLGITHDIINDDYRIKLTRRLERLLERVKSGNKIIFIYADATNKSFNYHLDDINFGIDATEYLTKIYDLLYPLNNNIEILYFSWKENMHTSNKIKHIEHTQEVVNDKNGNCIREKISKYITTNYK
jgi:hypothetical protein